MNALNEPVLISIESTRFFVPNVVVAIEEDKLPMLELNPDVVVATELDKNPIEDVNDELKLVIVLVNPDIVVATELDKFPILVDILELNVEYPVVPVMIT